jgi:hypothetical protein
MDARFATLDSPTCRATSRRWRILLAGLISVALMLSLFHCPCLDCDDPASTLSIAQLSSDGPGKAPAHAVPIHCDHCLTHVSTVATQETSVAIEYIPHAYGLLSMRAPETAEPIFPFKPPRA